MPDGYSPTLVTVDEEGRVGADFTGHVKAQGLDLDAATDLSPPADRRIRWLRESDGSRVAQIVASEAGGTARMLLGPDDNISGADAISELVMGAGADMAGGAVALGAGLLARLHPLTPADTVVEAYAQPAPGVKIIDGDGDSDFARLVFGGHVGRLDAGAGAHAHVAAADFASAIAHGLGVVPRAVLVQADWPYVASVQVAGMSATQFQVNTWRRDNAAFTATVNFVWLAIA